MAYFVICYDITNNKRRRLIVKLLGNWGAQRVQYSVFEIKLAKNKLQILLSELEKVMLKRKDSLGVYELCETCRSKVIRKGQSGKLYEAKVVVA